MPSRALVIARAVLAEHSHPGHKIYPYLLRKLRITRANQVWALNTSYIPMARGFVYLTAVVNVASRKVLTYKVKLDLTRFRGQSIFGAGGVQMPNARFGNNR